MDYIHSEHFNLSNFVCLIQNNKYFTVRGFSDTLSFEHTINSKGLCTLQQSTKYITAKVITENLNNLSELTGVTLSQVNKKLQNQEYIIVSYSQDFKLSLSITQSISSFIEKTSRSSLFFSTYLINTITLLQQLTKLNSKTNSYEDVRAKICLLNNNKIFTTITYTGAPNKYFFSSVVSPTDCQYDAKTSTKLKKYNYYIDLNNTYYDLNLPFSIDFEDSSVDMTEATIDINF